jgi:hypothetical protein
MKARTNPIRYYAMLIRVLTAPVPGHRRNSARTAEPVTFGVPLAEGVIKDPATWTLGGRIAQTRVLDRWGDGSARWVLVDGQIDLGADGLGAVELETDRRSHHGRSRPHSHRRQRIRSS